MMHLLLVEDDMDLSEVLEALLERNNYTVDTVHNGSVAYDYICATEYDGIILDIMLPGMNGMEVLEKIRKEKNNVPVMMLTAKGECEDRIAGFDAGADDYLPKPFSPKELLSRLRAILRRKEMFSSDTMEFCDLVFYRDTGVIKCNSLKAMLSGREFQILEVLMSEPEKLFSAEKLMDRVWGWNNEVELNAIWVHISNLRKKLGKINTSVTINSRRGLGYVLEEKK